MQLGMMFKKELKGSACSFGKTYVKEYWHTSLPTQDCFKSPALI